MNIVLNGEVKQMNNIKTLVQALSHWDITITDVAIAIDKEFVPRANYAEIILQDGMHVDIVSPMQGG